MEETLPAVVPGAVRSEGRGLVQRRLSQALAARFAQQALSFGAKVVTLPMIIAAIGFQDYGNWVIALEGVSYIALVKLGFPTAQARFFARSASAGGSPSRSVASFLVLNLILTLLSLAGVGIIYFVLGTALGFRRAADLAVWLGLFATLGIPSGVYAAFLQSRLREAGSEVAAIAATLAQALAVYFFLRAGWGLGGLLVAQGLFTLVQVSALQFAFRRTLGPVSYSLKDFHPGTLLEVIPSSMHIGVNLLSALVLTATDGIVIGAFLGAEAVGKFDLSRKLLVLAVPSIFALSDIFFPLIARSTGSLAAARRLYLGVLELTMTVAGWIAAFYLAFGTAILRVWTGRDDLGVPLLLGVLLGLFFLIQTTVHVGGVFLQAAGETKAFAHSSIRAAVIKLTLSLLLVRSLRAEGVILASLAAVIAGNGIHIPLLLLRKMAIPFREYGRLILLRVAVPAALAAAVAGCVDLSRSRRAVVVAFAVGLTLAYALLAWLLLGARRRREALEWLRGGLPS